ncbi:MAG: hypothetical protein WBF42_15595 [Terracidiphilus sp.]
MLELKISEAGRLGDNRRMKWIVGIAVVIILVLSLVADYKWRQWMAARKDDRDVDPRR